MSKKYAVVVVVALLLTAGCMGGSERPNYLTAAADPAPNGDPAYYAGSVNETIEPVQQAVKTGVSNVTQRADNVDEGVIVADDGYYTINRSVVATANATHVSYTVTETDTETAAYGIDDLTPTDQQVIMAASVSPGDDIKNGTIGNVTYETDTAVEASVLYDTEPTTVRHNGSVYSVDRSGVRSEVIARYRYTATRPTAEVCLTDSGGDTIDLDSASASARSFFEFLAFERDEPYRSQYRGDVDRRYSELSDALPANETVDGNTWAVCYREQRYTVLLNEHNGSPI